MIREALATDAAPIAQVQTITWRDAYRGIIADDYLAALSIERTTRGWLGWLLEHDPLCFARVATDDAGKVVGFAMGGPARNSASISFVAEVQVLYLLPEHQRQGQGAALLRSMARGFEQRGMRALEIWALEDNPARTFYDRQGGIVRGRRDTPVGSQRLREVQYVWPSLEPFTRRRAVSERS